jgi:hypothetical protein
LLHYCCYRLNFIKEILHNAQVLHFEPTSAYVLLTPLSYFFSHPSRELVEWSVQLSHSLILPTILGRIPCRLHSSPRMKLPYPSTSVSNYSNFIITVKSSHDPINMDKEPNTKASHPSSQINKNILLFSDFCGEGFQIH